MTDTDRTPQLTRRGALRRLGHSAAGLMLAAAVPAVPTRAAPATDPRLEQALERIRVAWEHVPERDRTTVARCLPGVAVAGAAVYGGWTAPEGWLVRRDVPA